MCLKVHSYIHISLQLFLFQRNDVVYKRRTKQLLTKQELLNISKFQTIFILTMQL